MSKLQILLMFFMGLAHFQTAEAQSIPDPFVNSATVGEAPTIYGAGNSISFQFLNVSPVGILTVNPPTTLKIQLSNMTVVGNFNPANVTGVGSTFFAWSYNPASNEIMGTLNTAVPPLTGGLININGLLVIDSSQASDPQTGFNVNVNASGSNNVSLTNDFTSSYTFTQGTPLPLEWLSFDVFRVGQDAQINWSTAFEENVSHFTVEFSTDGVNFAPIKTEEAKNKPSQNDYSFVHDIRRYIETVKINPILYYRVLQYDMDSKRTMTTIKKLPLSIGLDGGFGVNYFPNPATDFLNVSVSGINIEEGVYYRLLDMNGRVVFEQRQTVDVESDAIKIPVTALARGSYMLRVDNGTFEFADKVLLK